MLIEILLSWSNSRGFHTNHSLFQIAVILAALTVIIYWNLCYVTYIRASTLWNKTRTSDTSLAFAQCFVTIHVIDTSFFDRKGKAKLLDLVFLIQYWLFVNELSGSNRFSTSFCLPSATVSFSLNVLGWLSSAVGKVSSTSYVDLRPSKMLRKFP